MSEHLRVLDFPEQAQRRRDSPFLLKMRELESYSPCHAAVLYNLAADILKERKTRVWSWRDNEEGA